jgi:hypothetical protein
MDEFVDWFGFALLAGPAHLETLVQGLERDALDLGIDPSAWDNGMAALEWAVMQGLTNERVTGMPATEEDLQRIRRVHALGSSALGGEDRSQELLSLARQCLHMLQGAQRPPV